MARSSPFPHVTERINRFLNPASGDSFTISISPPNRSFVAVTLGRGPGEGTIKRIVPEGHTDFIFAVAAKEFGVVLCLIPGGTLAFIVIRALIKAMRTKRSIHPLCLRWLHHPVRPAINHMAVNLHLMPAKGMTFPSFSYGKLFADLARLRHGHAAGARRKQQHAELAGDILLAATVRVMAATAAPVLVTAGGTGGHLFPAEALATALAEKRGRRSSRDRSRRGVFGGAFAEDAIHVVASATLRGRNPFALTRTAAVLGVGFMQAWRLIGRLKPAAVIGFGGCATIRPVMAATASRRPHPRW